MKKILSTMLLVVLMTSTALAHTLFMNVNDNEDGSVTIEGMYSTGAIASDTEVRLEGADGKILIRDRTDDDGEFEFKKPAEPYTITLDAGPGHIVTEEGPQ